MIVMQTLLCKNICRYTNQGNNMNLNYADNTAETARVNIRGILLEKNTNISATALKAAMFPQAVHRFMGGKGINLTNLDAYCQEGLEMTLYEVLKWGDK